MKSNNKWTKMTKLFTLLVMGSLFFTACSISKPDRGQLLQKIEHTKKRFEENPDNVKTRFQFAKRLYQAGEFLGAEEILRPLLDMPEPSQKVMFLMAELTYLAADYTETEAILNRIRESFPLDKTVQVKAQLGLAYVYYQTNQYAKTLDLFKGMNGKIEHPQLELLKSFKNNKPYQMEWLNNDTMTVVPFEITDPLPLIPVEVQDEPIYVLIDTGGDTFIIDNELADSLGIEAVSSAAGTFGGGKKAELGFARAGSLKIGEVIMKEVPVMILPTKRWSEGFEGGKYTINGVVGTGVLRQFLSTLDYEHGRLILREKTAESRRRLRQELSGREVTEVPFVLAETHFIMAKGRLNDKKDLTFFVDSGLASDAAFTAPKQTLKYAGIPLPKTEIDEESVGGGGKGLWATGIFPIETVGLGPLIQYDVKGEYGTMTSESYWEFGFIEDGLISHGFLRRYDSWTIDFVDMKMIFAQ